MSATAVFSNRALYLKHVITMKEVSQEMCFPEARVKYAIQIGDKFGRLTVLRKAPSAVLIKKNGHRQTYKVWLCQCSCGNQITVRDGNLKGKTKSCKCLRNSPKTHGFRSASKTLPPEYTVWVAMRQRCNNPAGERYKDYGGRGIAVCERWQTSFENFYSDMGSRPTSKHMIERKDNDGNYEPSNCVWATRSEQANNTRSNHRITIGNRTENLLAWFKILNISDGTYSYRIKRGMTPIQALVIPIVNPK